MGRGAIRPIFQAQIGNLDIVMCPNVWKTPIDRVAKICGKIKILDLKICKSP